MSDLVVVRCPDKARHALIRIARTPRGVEATMSMDLKPQTYAKVRDAMDRMFQREPRTGKGQKWSTKLWEEWTRDDDVVTVFCRCQAWIDVEVEQVNKAIQRALDTGKTQTIRAAFD